MTFKYLGANITSDRNLKKEVQAQRIKTALMSGDRNKYVSLRSKIRIYKTYETVMTCAIETRAETTITKGLLRTMRRFKAHRWQHSATFAGFKMP
jgi:uncharacterized Fe-S cluster-containing radical SAM superfamily protein